MESHISQKGKIEQIFFLKRGGVVNITEILKLQGYVLFTFPHLAFFLTIFQTYFVHFMPQTIAITDNNNLQAAQSNGHFPSLSRRCPNSTGHSRSLFTN